MRYLSVCSGIEAASVAWGPLGWKAAAFSEIEAFPRAVLQHRFPEVPLHGDFTTIGADEYGPIDLLVGGTPCQSFSIAGLRGGLADDRGNLALEFLRLAQRTRAKWLVWENVPGVLSSNGGRDFGAILGGMVELGYGFAYRVLDAQFFGVPQRRRRVFVVGCLGDWRSAGAVLFERHSLQGHTPPRREKGQSAPTIPSRSTAGGGLGTDIDLDGGLIQWPAETASTLNAAFGSKMGLEDQHIRSGAPLFVPDTARTLTNRYDSNPCEDRGPDVVAFVQNSRDEVREFGGDGKTVGALTAEAGMKQQCYVAFSAKDYGADAIKDCSPTIRAGGHKGSHQNGGVMPAVAFGIDGGDIAHCLRSGASMADKPDSTTYAIQERAVSENVEAGPQGKGWQSDTAYTLEARNKVQSVATSSVRRLTPRECERLQGFPDDWTLIPYRGKPAADGPRYKALGNSMAVPCMLWLGQRIDLVESISQRKEAA